jgi:anti-sigma factor RsiW
MSALCPIVRQSFDDYLGDALPAPQRRMLREHLAACDACREAASSRDASLVFAMPFETEPVAAEDAAAILSAVRTGVGLIETERRIGSGVRRRFAGVAAAAAVALLVLSGPEWKSRTEPTVAAPTTPLPASPAVAEAELAPVAAPGESAAPSPDATVYDLNPGAGKGEPRVVWIVDRELDI